MAHSSRGVAAIAARCAAVGLVARRLRKKQSENKCIPSGNHQPVTK